MFLFVWNVHLISREKEEVGIAFIIVSYKSFDRFCNFVFRLTKLIMLIISNGTFSTLILFIDELLFRIALLLVLFAKIYFQSYKTSKMFINILSRHDDKLLTWLYVCVCLCVLTCQCNSVLPHFGLLFCHFVIIFCPNQSIVWNLFWYQQNFVRKLNFSSVYNFHKCMTRAIKFHPKNNNIHKQISTLILRGWPEIKADFFQSWSWCQFRKLETQALKSTRKLLKT